MSQRRYYVQTAAGELGPHNRLELRGLVNSGTVPRDARLRTAYGTPAGNVGDLLDSSTEELPPYRGTAPEVEVEVEMEIADPLTPEEARNVKPSTRERVRLPGSSRLSRPAAGTPGRPPVAFIAIALLAVAALVILFYAARR